MEVLTIAMSAISTIVSGGVLFFIQRFFKKKDITDKLDCKKDEIKAKENVLILKSIDIIGRLTSATAIAIENGKTNDDIQDAMNAYNGVKEELYTYLLINNSHK